MKKTALLAAALAAAGLLSACADEETVEAGAAGQQTDSFAVVVEDFAIAFCHCHHGFGFGLDATATILVANLGPDPVVLTVDRLTMRAEDTGLITQVADASSLASVVYDATEGDLGFSFRRAADPARAPAEKAAAMGGPAGWGSFTRSITIPAGSLDSLGLVVYKDPTPALTIEQAGSAPFEVTLSLSTDTGQTFDVVRRISVSFDPTSF
ncbi:MAG: hypothetical protein R3F39_07285 [Myxococcota bacterium]